MIITDNGKKLHYIKKIKPYNIKKGLLPYLIIGIIMLGVFYYFNISNNNVHEFTYDEFMKATNKVISLVDLVKRCHAAESAVAQNEAKTTDKEVLSVKADYKTQLVKIADIVYLESAGEYVRLHIDGGQTITTLFRLKNMEASLPANNFLRVHRSYIINLKRISSYTKGRIFLDNGEYIPLGENYKERFFNFL